MSDQTTWLFINSFAPWLAALGTVASVIVSLYLALRASRSDIRVFICIIQLFDSDPKEKLLQISAVNHSRKAVVKTIMWRSLGCFGRRKQDWIVQPLDPRSTKLPCDLGFGEEANFLIQIDHAKLVLEHVRDSKFPWLTVRRMRVGVITRTGQYFLAPLDHSMRKSILDRSRQITSPVSLAEDPTHRGVDRG